MSVGTEKKVWILVAVFAGLFAFGIYNVFKPDIPPLSFVRGEVREIVPGVLIGPYPTENEIFRLKRMGVVEIVSLMDASSPIEARLVEDGKMLASDNGLKHLNFSVDFTRLGSPANIELIDSAIRHVLDVASKERKVYVHCYLGRHRVGLFERELLKVSKTAPGRAPAG